MTADQFVEAVQAVVIEGSVQATMKNLAHPPGRAPTADLTKLSDWYGALHSRDQKMIEQSVRLAINHAVLSMMCVIDGAQAIEAGPDKGHLELFYVKGNARILLNDPEKEPLNDKLHR